MIGMASPYAYAFDRSAATARRAALGLSRGDLGARVGVHAQTIFHWETGVSAPTKKQASKLAAALGVSVPTLYFAVNPGGVPVA